MDICEIQNTQTSIFIPGITTKLLILAGGGRIFINWTHFWFKCYNVHKNVNIQPLLVFSQLRTTTTHTHIQVKLANNQWTSSII